MRTVSLGVRTVAILGVMGLAVSAEPAAAQLECSQCRACPGPRDCMVTTQETLPGEPVAYIVLACEEYMCDEMLPCNPEHEQENLLAFAEGVEMEDVRGLLALRESRGEVWQVIPSRRLLVLRSGCSGVPIATKRVSERMVAALLEAQ